MLSAVMPRIRQSMDASAAVPVLMLALLAMVFGIVQPTFATLGNASNVAIQASYLAIFALAQTYVMITRGFDLSLGTTVSLISVASGMAIMHVLGQGFSAAAAIGAGIFVGMAIGVSVGAINGICVAWLRLSPFVVTLATLNICLGLASSISQGFPIFNLPDGLNGTFYRAQLVSLPAPVIAAVALLAISFVLFHHTRFGRSLYLIGTNPRASAVAGLPSKVYVLSSYLICSFLVACGALLLTARTGSGEPNLGGNLMLESIAAAVVGGASLRGGRGGVASPIVGALFITVLSNGMNLTRIDGYVQQMILGLVIVATVFGDMKRGDLRS
ncbi:ABC transporter permease [Bradyrhizobium prioriisuperbiae]|uniref:ABC transporter permease n=1 Tax=Bradyrhizobium prioriisuperbiae TaxID=2854389 RepID=UPI0028EFD89D|nr:ABC transporter permease [Bradyrhizobium prioritasuperba]